MAAVAGVDGAKGRWLMAVVDTQCSATHDARCTLELLDHFIDVVDRVQTLGVVAVGVDMPIGLPSDGPRASDELARAVLGSRRATLFPTPSAGVLAARDYDHAQELNRAAQGRGLSKQAFNLVPYIAQVRSALECPAGDGTRGRFHEAHPETTFAVLAGEPLPPKHTAVGVGRRLKLLEDFVADPADLLAASPHGAAPDDVLDALAAAWSAARFVDGSAVTFGAGHDGAGFSLQLIA